ncbi:MAG TPA: hypothetical protein PLB85_01940, partial [Candidatus Syntrophosphaera sp.]|nr:hypothetical protein [Candidatus Syntrophosphaera sp.]
VDRHQVPDPAEWEKDKKKLLSEAKDKARQEHLNEWYRDERQKVNLIDNRRDFYDLNTPGRVIQL